MRFAVTFAGLILTLIATTSCATRSEPGRPTAAPTLTQQPTEAATPNVPPTVLPTTTPTPATSAAKVTDSQNVALLATGRASSGDESVQYATDGDPETAWSSQDHPAQWISITLDDSYLVERIELDVAQTPAGPTTHVLWVDNGSGVRTRFKQLTEIHTEDGQTLTIDINPPRPVKEILIQTLESPSWVAWREVRVLGSPLSQHNEKETSPQLRLEEILDQPVLPVQITHAGDGSNRIFAVEQQGRITIIKDGVANETLFLDISNHVNCCEEQSLFNIALPPSFQANQQIYLSYSDTSEDTVINRFTTTDDSDIADPGSEEFLLTVDQPHVVHSGGRIAFDPRDGSLYLGMGDGGSDGHPAHFSQDPKQLLGKTLQFDVESGVHPYAIPASNTYVSDDSLRDEIWPFRFRNIWRLALNSQMAELFIQYAEHNDREELNVQPASSIGVENYGWPPIEGTHWLKIANQPVPRRQTGNLAPPAAEYDHTRGCTIVGGVVYRGSQQPHLKGRFHLADFCRGDVWSLVQPPATASPRPVQGNHSSWRSEIVSMASVQNSSVEEVDERNLYVTGYQDGVAYLITEE